MKKAATPRKKTAAKVRRAPAKAKVAPPPKDSRLLQLIVRALDDKKAADIRVFDVSQLSSITDYLVLATVLAAPHLRALRIELEKVIDADKTKILGIDASKDSGWTVVDAFDVMVHLFTAENRDKYRLDLLWKDAAEVSVSSLLS